MSGFTREALEASNTIFDIYVQVNQINVKKYAGESIVKRIEFGARILTVLKECPLPARRQFYDRMLKTLPPQPNSILAIHQSEQYETALRSALGLSSKISLPLVFH